MLNRFFPGIFFMFLSMSASAGTIVVMGDSISAGFGIEAGRDWVSLMENRLEAEGCSCRVFNESISGESSAGGLARIDRALELHKPDIVILELGANDGLRGYSPKVMKENLAEMIRRSEAAGASVLLVGMRLPPNYGKRYIELFFDIYRQLEEEFGVTRVPFIMEKVALKPSLMLPDRLHPNAMAQPIMLETVWPYLEKVIEKNGAKNRG